MQNPVRIHINLLQKEVGSHRGWYYWGLSIIMMLILIGLAVYYNLSAGKELKHLQFVNTYLKSEIRKNEQGIALTTPIIEMGKLIDSKVQGIDLIEKHQMYFVDAWENIDESVPAQILIVGIEINPQKVVVTGLSPDHGKLAGFIQNLERRPRFKNVAALSSQMNENSNEVSFTMEINWEAIKN